jgi:hypothetical protein
LSKQRYWETKKFKSLQSEWDDKLADSGFKDAEKTLRGKRVLINSSNPYRRFETADVAENQREAIAPYYEQMAQMVLSRRFDKALDKFVLEKYILDYWSIAEICRDLKRRGKVPCGRFSIRNIIYKYTDRWKIKRHTQY